MPTYLVVFAYHMSWTQLRRSEKLPCVAPEAADTADAKADRPRKEKNLGKKNEKEEIKSPETTTKLSMVGWNKIFLTFL